jgi:hypothetical protein
MEISTKQYYILFLIIISFILLVSIFKWIDYLTSNNYIVESFTSAQVIPEDITGGTTSHTVNLPLTTSYSCKNFCGPTSRCAITGQQCFTDIDCPGCQPYTPPLKVTGEGVSGKGIPGDNDAGKLTWGVTPQYSPLTSGYGTHELVITSDMFSKPAMPNFGVNTWLAEFNEEQSLFNKRYQPPQLEYMPNYPQRYSLTGEFIEDGPFASNAPIPTN